MEDLLLFNKIRPEHVGACLLAEHLRAGGKTIRSSRPSSAS